MRMLDDKVAVALVRPPTPVVAACPALCVIGLHSPHVDITLGADKVERVCGDARYACVVAAGDWNGMPRTRHSWASSPGLATMLFAPCSSTLCSMLVPLCSLLSALFS